MMENRNHILVVDDEDQTRQLLHIALSEEHFETIEASDGVGAIQLIKSEWPDLVILDVRMPDIDGLKVLRHIRQLTRVPVIMLSGLIRTSDKATCLDLGADDYVTKPFAIEELLARVRAVLRRTEPVSSLSKHPNFDDGNLRIEFEKRKVMVGGVEVRLTKLEYALLQELVDTADKVSEYESLLKTVWGAEYQDAKDSLHHYVNSLRKKIEPDPRKPRYIINLPGVGYRFNADG